jgi:hypothetical protein
MTFRFAIVKNYHKNNQFPPYYTISEVLFDKDISSASYIEASGDLFYLEEDSNIDVKKYFLDQLELIKNDILNSPIVISRDTSSSRCSVCVVV